MNKKQMIETVATRTGLPKAQVEKTIDSLVEVVGETLKSGDTVAIANFGTFKVKTVAARSGVMKGKEWSSPESKSVSFKPYSHLTDTIKG